MTASSRSPDRESADTKANGIRSQETWHVDCSNTDHVSEQ